MLSSSSFSSVYLSGLHRKRRRLFRVATILSTVDYIPTEPQLTIPTNNSSRLRPIIPQHSQLISPTFNRFNQLLRTPTCTALYKIEIISNQKID